MRPFLYALLLACLLQFLNTCMNFQYSRLTRSNAQMARYMERKKAPAPRFYSTRVGEYDMRYMVVGDTAKPILFFLHGSPGSLNDYDEYLCDSTLFSRYCLVGVDRPGYGYSSFGRTDTSVLHQAAICIGGLRNIIGSRPYHVFGYSFGGPVAAAVAALDPQQVRSLLLLSAAIAPGEEKIYKISYTIDDKKWRWLFPRVLRISNDEKLSHEVALKALAPILGKSRCPAFIVHGDEDELVYFSNLGYGKAMIPGADQSFTIKGGTHSILWSEQGEIKKQMLQFFH